MILQYSNLDMTFPPKYLEGVSDFSHDVSEFLGIYMNREIIISYSLNTMPLTDKCETYEPPSQESLMKVSINMCLYVFMYIRSHCRVELDQLLDLTRRHTRGTRKGRKAMKGNRY